MYTKRKGSEEQLKKVNLVDFMGQIPLPDIDLTQKWNTRGEGLGRRKLNFRNDGPVLPSLIDALEKNKNKNALTRKHSTSSRDENAKNIKHREGDAGEQQTTEDMEEDGLPASGNHSEIDEDI